VIEVHLDLDGFPVTVIDTAGIRDTDDPVEQEGVRRARARAADADLVLWLTDAQGSEEGWSDDGTVPIWKVQNKIDLEIINLNPAPTSGHAPSPAPRAGKIGSPPALRGRRLESDDKIFAISAKRGDGLPELIGALVEFASDFFGRSEGALVTRARQRELLSQAASSLRRCIDLVEEGEELVAEELRAASYSLGRLLGRVDVEDVLGTIFLKFCIGK
jgi:tRNA modification GTPase